jgi:ADP-ribose pyrophosphatase YjhB (NUDIX family)
MEPQWLTWAKQLQSISSTGLFFAKDPYDQERYEQIADIANNMLSQVADQPIERVESLISDFAKGYTTPRVDVRGALIQEDKILLVQEGSDGLWTLPGGFADVGVSPTENIVKEIEEEASIRVSADGIYSVRHKAKHDYDPDVRDFYKLFFACSTDSSVEPRATGIETVNVGFFALDELPPLSRGRVIEQDIHNAFDYRDSGGRRVFCD